MRVLHHVPEPPHAAPREGLLRPARRLLALLAGLRGGELGLLLLQPLQLLVLLLPEAQLAEAAPLQVVILQAPVEQLLLEGKGAHLPQQPQLPRRQEGHYDAEGRRVPVEKVLVAADVVVVAHVHDLGLIAAAAQLAQSGQRELIQRGPGDVILDPPDVDNGRSVGHARLVSVLLVRLRLEQNLGSLVEQALLGCDFLWIFHTIKVERGELVVSVACQEGHLLVHHCDPAGGTCPAQCVECMKRLEARHPFSNKDRICGIIIIKQNKVNSFL